MWKRSVIGVRSIRPRELYENNIHPERSGPSWRKNRRSRPWMNIVITLVSIFLPQLLVIWLHSDIQSLARFLVRRALKFTQTVSYLREISRWNWTTARECDRRISMTFRGSFTEHFVYAVYISKRARNLALSFARDWRSCLGSRDAKIRSLS